MGHIEEQLREAIALRHDRTMKGALIGFVLGFAFGIDFASGIVGAIVVGWVTHCLYSGEVERLKKIQELNRC